MQEITSENWFIFFVLILILVYIIFQAVIEKYHIHIIHETGLGIMIGFLIGWGLYEAGGIYDFDGEQFFNFILPPIIFSGKKHNL